MKVSIAYSEKKDKTLVVISFKDQEEIEDFKAVIEEAYYSYSIDPDEPKQKVVIELPGRQFNV